MLLKEKDVLIAELLQNQRKDQVDNIVTRAESKQVPSPDLNEQKEAIQNLRREANRITEAMQMIEHATLKKPKNDAPLASLYGMNERDNWLLGGSSSQRA